MRFHISNIYNNIEYYRIPCGRSRSPIFHLTHCNLCNEYILHTYVICAFYLSAAKKQESFSFLGYIQFKNVQFFSTSFRKTIHSMFEKSKLYFFSQFFISFYCHNNATKQKQILNWLITNIELIMKKCKSMDKIIIVGYIRWKMFNVNKWYATSNDEEENKGEKTDGKKRRRFRLIHKMTSIKCERKSEEIVCF